MPEDVGQEFEKGLARLFSIMYCLWSLGIQLVAVSFERVKMAARRLSEPEPLFLSL